MKKLFLALPIVLLSLASCSPKLQGYSTNDGFTPTTVPGTIIMKSPKAIKVDKSFKYENTLKNITIKDAGAYKGILYISIEHAGGCGSHDYELVFNKNKKNELFLTQNTGDDVCNGHINKLLKFDLENYKTAGSLKLVGYGKQIPLKK